MLFSSAGWLFTPAGSLLVSAGLLFIMARNQITTTCLYVGTIASAFGFIARPLSDVGIQQFKKAILRLSEKFLSIHFAPCRK